MMEAEKKDDVCPCCGYCKHCGRSDRTPQWVTPWVLPYPYTPQYPWYPGPVWIGGNTYGETSGNIIITSTSSDWNG